MSTHIATDGGLTIGLDLGDRFTEGRVLDESGEVVEALRVRTPEPALSSGWRASLRAEWCSRWERTRPG